MKRWLNQLEVALVVTLGFWVGPLAAQTPAAPAPQQYILVPAPQPGQTPAPPTQTQYILVPAPAANPPAPTPTLPTDQEIKQVYAVVPVVPFEHPLAPPAATKPPRTHIKEWLNRHGYCCWSTHFQPGCGNLHSDLTFIFGSCRSFFGEQCLQDPGVPISPFADTRGLNGAGTGAGGPNAPCNAPR